MARKLLGASSALGPLKTLLACGATVLAVARPKPEHWRELSGVAAAIEKLKVP